jgi:hypothetical protein
MFLMDAVKGMFCRLSAFKVFSLFFDILSLYVSFLFEGAKVILMI